MTFSVLPSFKEQIAVVYDDYMDTLGGGERSALAYAKALSQLGFTTEIISTRQIPEKEKIVSLFGNEFEDILVRRVETKNLYQYLKSAGITVFVNHTYLSFLKNPAKIGIYSQMFPNIIVNNQNAPEETAYLNTYNLMMSNSSFTKNYSDAYWSFPSENNHVLHPPISSEHIEAGKRILNNPIKKSKVFVNIGRFNPGNHNKNQKILIENFLVAMKHYPELENWTLRLIGNENNTDEAKAYLKECKELARLSYGKIEILNGINQKDLASNLEQAFGYVHATGAFIPPGVEPHKCEHLGLGILEAMAYGCMPLVYARGGIFDIIEPGVSGIPYITQDGLIEGFAEIAKLYINDAGTEIQQKCVNAAMNCSQDIFTRKLLNHIAKALTSG